MEDIVSCKEQSNKSIYENYPFTKEEICSFIYPPKIFKSQNISLFECQQLIQNYKGIDTYFELITVFEHQESLKCEEDLFYISENIGQNNITYIYREDHNTNRISTSDSSCVFEIFYEVNEIKNYFINYHGSLSIISYIQDYFNLEISYESLKKKLCSLSINSSSKNILSYFQYICYEIVNQDINFKSLVVIEITTKIQCKLCLGNQIIKKVRTSLTLKKIKDLITAKKKLSKNYKRICSLCNTSSEQTLYKEYFLPKYILVTSEKKKLLTEYSKIIIQGKILEFAEDNRTVYSAFVKIIPD